MPIRPISMLSLFAALILSHAALAGDADLQFKKLVLTDRYYCDGINAGDINGDGAVDVVAGPFWYEGPDFQRTHEIYPPEVLPPEKSPSNSMFTFLHDWSGDGRLDVLALGRVHMHEAYWYENSAAEEKPWAKHYAFERVRGESPTLVDVDGDGRPELLAHWDNRWGFIAPDWQAPREPWQFHPVGHEVEWPQFYHGEGIGDLNADGRLDVVLTDGWYEQPPSEPWQQEWTFHEGPWTKERGGAQMFAEDVNGDGLTDMVTALDAHGWGLAWFEQLPDGNATGEDVVRIGGLAFRQHRLMGSREEESRFGVAFSQPHALEFHDLDGDGRKDIIVGKRMWAHGPTGDVEPMAAPVVYWFEAVTQPGGEAAFIPHLIDDHSGVGTQVTVADVNQDQRPDVLTASKLGSFVFLNQP